MSSEVLDISISAAPLAGLAAIWFVHPALALAGAACGAIPVLIHLLNRRRHKRVEWAAMRFLLLASRRSARRLRLEQLLLLALRVAVVVGVALLVARPYFPSSTSAARLAGILPFVGTGVHRILVVDNSLSMGARVASGTRLDVARQRAHELLATFSPRDAVSLVTLAAPEATVVGHAAFDRRFVTEGIDSIGQSQRATDVPGAIRAVLEILEASPSAPANRAVYVLSDFQRSVWLHDATRAKGTGSVTGLSSAELPTLAASELGRLADALTNPADNLILVQVDSHARSNASVKSLTAESAFVAPGLPLRFEAVIANHGATLMRGLGVQFRTGSRIIGEVPLAEIPSGEQAVVGVTAQFADAGTHTIEARLAVPGLDDLAVDDARFQTIEVREKTRVLIVDPGPTASFNESEGAYLAAALDPASVSTRGRRGHAGGGVSRPGDDRKRSVSPFSVELSTQHELSFQALPDFDVVAVCNVPSLARSDWQRLAMFVDQGGGLLVFLGDQVDAQSYNQGSTSVGGGGLLPATLLQTVRVGGSSGYGPDASAPDPVQLRLTREPLVHPFLREFARQERSGLFDARIEAYTRVAADVATGEVVWTYSNGDPAWVLGSRGRGNVLLCTTSANMRWNTLPAKGDYVSLMLNAVSFSARGSGTKRNVVVGERIRERLSAMQTSLPIRVVPPPVRPFQQKEFRGETPSPALIRVGNGMGTEYGPVESCGVWRVVVGGSEREFAVNVDPSESLLAGVSSKALLDAVGREMLWIDASDAAFTRREDQTARSTEVSRGVLWVVVGLVALESLLAMLFGKPLGRRRQRDRSH